jgi:hypothetical protein
MRASSSHTIPQSPSRATSTELLKARGQAWPWPRGSP